MYLGQTLLVAVCKKEFIIGEVRSQFHRVDDNLQ
jgi:hypothetical protein